MPHPEVPGHLGAVGGRSSGFCDPHHGNAQRRLRLGLPADCEVRPQPYYFKVQAAGRPGHDPSARSTSLDGVPDVLYGHKDSHPSLRRRSTTTLMLRKSCLTEARWAVMGCPWGSGTPSESGASFA